MRPIEDSIILQFLDRVKKDTPIGEIRSRQRLLYDLAEELDFPLPRTKAFRDIDFRTTKQTITQTMNRAEGWERYDEALNRSKMRGIAWRRIA